MQNVGNFLGATFMLLSGTFATLFGSYILIQIPSSYKTEADFKARAISSESVTEAKSKRRFVNTSTGGYEVIDIYATVRFQSHKGDYIEFADRNVCEKRLLKSVESDVSACVGKKVPVLYIPDNPENARVASKINPTNAVWGGLLLGSVCLVGGIVQLTTVLRV
jgi:hypothetical protein